MEKEDEDDEAVRRGRCKEVVWPTPPHVGTTGMLGGMEAVEGGVWWGDS